MIKWLRECRPCDLFSPWKTKRPENFGEGSGRLCLIDCNCISGKIMASFEEGFVLLSAIRLRIAEMKVCVKNTGVGYE